MVMIKKLLVIMICFILLFNTISCTKYSEPISPQYESNDTKNNDHTDNNSDNNTDNNTDIDESNINLEKIDKEECINKNAELENTYLEFTVAMEYKDKVYSIYRDYGELPIPIEGYQYTSLDYSRNVKAQLFMIWNDTIYYLLDDGSQDSHFVLRMELWSIKIGDNQPSLLAKDVSSDAYPIISNDFIYYVSFDTNNVKRISTKNGELLTEFCISDMFSYLSYITLTDKYVILHSFSDDLVYRYDFESGENKAIGTIELVDMIEVYEYDIYFAEKHEQYELNKISYRTNEKSNLGVNMDTKEYSIIDGSIYYNFEKNLYIHNMESGETSRITTLDEDVIFSTDYFVTDSFIYFLTLNHGNTDNVTLWYYDKESEKKEYIKSWYQE
jgi:hypothetical protein